MIDDNLPTIIDAADFEAAQNDPRVHAILEEARAYAQALVARGHCRCHFVVNCPRDDPSSA